jgi:hypothetical protein
MISTEAGAVVVVARIWIIIRNPALCVHAFGTFLVACLRALGKLA